KALIPTVIALYLNYVTHNLGKPLPAILASLLLCKHSNCTLQSINIICLLFDHKLQYH
ncbi:hypothetical protein OG21DRAFT_1424368, partial [Imleria badia]